MEASQTSLSALEVELARLEKAKVERQSLREAVKAAEVQIASKEKAAGGERPFLGTGVGIAGNLKEGV